VDYHRRQAYRLAPYWNQWSGQWEPTLYVVWLCIPSPKRDTVTSPPVLISLLRGHPRDLAVQMDHSPRCGPSTWQIPEKGRYISAWQSVD
jgi:hypothetical protein